MFTSLQRAKTCQWIEQIHHLSESRLPFDHNNRLFWHKTIIFLDYDSSASLHCVGLENRSGIRARASLPDHTHIGQFESSAIETKMERVGFAALARPMRAAHARSGQTFGPVAVQETNFWEAINDGYQA